MTPAWAQRQQEELLCDCIVSPVSVAWYPRTASSASSRLRIGVGDFGNCWDTSKHKEVSHEQEVCRPAVG
jgi:hypothetical protein